MAQQDKNIVVDGSFDKVVGISITNVTDSSSDFADLSDDVDIVIGERRLLLEKHKNVNLNTSGSNRSERVDCGKGRCGSVESLLDKGGNSGQKETECLGFPFPGKLVKIDARFGGSSPCIIEDGKKDDINSVKNGLFLGDFNKCKSRSQEIKIQNRFDMSPTLSTKRQIPLVVEGVTKVCRLTKKDYKKFDDIKYRNLKWEQHYLVLEKDHLKSAKVTCFSPSMACVFFFFIALWLILNIVSGIPGYSNSLLLFIKVFNMKHSSKWEIQFCDSNFTNSATISMFKSNRIRESNHEKHV